MDIVLARGQDLNPLMSRMAGRGTMMDKRLGVQDLLNRITFDPDQCGGRPCVRGMRIRVKDVLDLLAAGETEDSIMEDYPYLEREDIRACLAYAATQTDHPVLRAAS